jgi:hypothetical protein
MGFNELSESPFTGSLDVLPQQLPTLQLPSVYPRPSQNITNGSLPSQNPSPPQIRLIADLEKNEPIGWGKRLTK